MTKDPNQELFDSIQQIQEKKQDDLLSRANVVAVGIGFKSKGGQESDQLCLTTFVEQKLPGEALSKDDKIPGSIDGIKTDVIETGVIQAGQQVETEQSVDIELLRNRVRPAQGGYSVGHYRITAGTFGTAVYDASAFPGIPRRYYILSNNHVLANSNDARIGDPILQPGPYDGGQVKTDTIARLSRFVSINFRGGNNYVDAAIAEGNFHELDREIYWIGHPRGIGTSSLRVGTYVQKTGRTTNYTTGRVTAMNATVNVNYGGGRVARFVRQIMTSNMSAGGDSGSLLLDLEGRAVGLLFAGSSTVTIHNDIRYVQSLLGIRIG